MKKRIIVAAVVGLMVAAGMAWASETTASWGVSMTMETTETPVSPEYVSEREQLIETFARVSESVGALYAMERDGDMNFLCTITAVDTFEGKTVLLTAFHCVRKGVAYLVNFGDNQFHPAQVWKIPHYEASPDEQRDYNEPKTDMALFVSEHPAPLTPIAKAGRMPVQGGKIVTVGFPLGLAKVRYEGIVSGYMDRPGSDDDGYMLLQIFGAPGSSGSAVVDAVTGEVVGVLVAGQQARGGLPVIFATPHEYEKYLAAVPGFERPEDDTSGTADIVEPQPPMEQ